MIASVLLPLPSDIPPGVPAGIDVRTQVPLARHTYLRIGGPARFFAEPRSLDEVALLFAWARSVPVAVRVIGGGSNILVADEGVDALVITLRRACGQVRFDGTRVTAGAAVMLPALARAAAAEGLSGLEFAVGIPGSLGGALQTNAGIGDGRSIGPLIDSVDVLGARGPLALPREELRFGYRESSLRGSGVMVTAAALQLGPRPREAIEAEMRRLLTARAAAQPTAQPNAGSVFRNPPGDHAGRLIEAAGCKGLAVGGARVSELHANFIVHDGGATARDVAALMRELQERVQAHAGIWLVPEIEWWGPAPAPAAFPAPPSAELED
ncbi:MAG: UDP-N-acetylmuramate dehydrogenase [Dehalococcoidia bacterium]|nr:UDP-N-acetylmuramate dehydrogenase [Dehalococcoidia bacterium]